MSKHTKGPWTCHSGSVYVDGPDVYPKGDNDGIPIAHMDREPGNGTEPVERDANAALIAAAPDLLEACKGARQALSGRIDAGDPLSLMINAAIAKAEPKP